VSEVKRVFIALANGKTWYLSITYFLSLTGFWAVTFFLPTIISASLGTSAVNSGLISAIPWTVVFFSILLVQRLTRSSDHHVRWLVCLYALAAVALAVAAFSGNPWIALVGLTVALCGVQSAAPLFYGLQTSVFTGVMTAVLLAMVNSIGNFGGFVGPFIFGFAKDVTGSDSAGIAIMGVFLLLAAILVSFARKVLPAVPHRDIDLPETETSPGVAVEK
jgi:nitrate/nitrite transporter NarK